MAQNPGNKEQVSEIGEIIRASIHRVKHYICVLFLYFLISGLFFNVVKTLFLKYGIHRGK